MIDKLWKIYTVSTPTEDPSVLHELFQSGYRKNDSILSVQHIPQESHTEYICETEKRTIHVLYFDKEGIALVGFLPTTCASDRIAFPWFARVLSYLQEGLELLPLAFDDEQLLDFAFNYGHSSYIELYLTFYVKEVHVGVEQIVFGFQSSDDHSKEDVLKHFHWATGIDIYRLRSYNSWIAPQLTRVKSADVLLGDKGNVKFYGEDVPKNLERFIRTIMKFA